MRFPRMEMDLMRRERELMQRELKLLQLENDALRRPTGPIQEPERRSTRDIREVGELLPEFSGMEQSFQNWKTQLNLLVATYNLDDSSSRILIGSKLKGKALSWFQSRTEHLQVSTEELLSRMETMFDYRESRLEVRRKFELRKWITNESFNEYFHDKLILANRVPVPDEEIVDSAIDGIPDQTLRNQARLCNFTTTPALLKAFSKVRLPRASRNPATSGISMNQSRMKELSTAKESAVPPAVPPIRCYNCNRIGHRSLECRLPKREKGSCFHCGGMGHLFHTCPKRVKPQVTCVQTSPPPDSKFHSDVNYELGDVKNEPEVGLRCQDWPSCKSEREERE
ncbi:FU domain-containing protein T48 isoform X3 [Megachile rotundata]|uniref:FU domain-containing protein T48 isoform X3 n=1 Tax=Megachile rotundata TaxID=143995 RepID=UPI003FD4DB5C